ncbi:unnamed protein product [Toxocara canis]|uniref:LAMA5 n=1 Tax=Toxocara canis TaxID=6265 RepID=A0A183VEZ4_TOXCA|nr:unnamed protein product [Toxocara canis]
MNTTIEQCVCPPGYIGTSCEDCAPGYSRTGGGLYLGLCERCECHGHATQCDKEHGFCVDCQHNTEADQCERCKPGFTGDARRGTPRDCQPAATRPPCNCNNHSPRGCDSFGRCLMCEHNTEGYHCEHCKKGFYGDAVRGTPFDCTPCPCPLVIPTIDFSSKASNQRKGAATILKRKKWYWWVSLPKGR